MKQQKDSMIDLLYYTEKLNYSLI